MKQRSRECFSVQAIQDKIVNMPKKGEQGPEDSEPESRQG